MTQIGGHPCRHINVVLVETKNKCCFVVLTLKNQKIIDCGPPGYLELYTHPYRRLGYLQNHKMRSISTVRDLIYVIRFPHGYEARFARVCLQTAVVTTTTTSLCPSRFANVVGGGGMGMHDPTMMCTIQHIEIVCVAPLQPFHVPPGHRTASLSSASYRFKSSEKCAYRLHIIYHR